MARTLQAAGMYRAQAYLNGMTRLLGDFPRNTNWESLLDPDEYANKEWLESLKQDIEKDHAGHELDLIKLPSLRILNDKLNFSSCGQFTILDNLIAGIGAIQDCLKNIDRSKESMSRVPNLDGCDQPERLYEARHALAGLESKFERYQLESQDVLGELRRLQISELEKVFLVPIPDILKQSYTLTYDEGRVDLLQRLATIRDMLKPPTRRTQGVYLQKINAQTSKHIQVQRELNEDMELIIADIRHILG